MKNLKIRTFAQSSKFHWPKVDYSGYTLIRFPCSPMRLRVRAQWLKVGPGCNFFSQIFGGLLGKPGQSKIIRQFKSKLIMTRRASLLQRVIRMRGQLRQVRSCRHFWRTSQNSILRTMSDEKSQISYLCAIF